MAKHRVIFVSKDESFSLDRKAADEISRRDPDMTFCYVAANTAPLATVYNAFLSEPDAAEWDYTYFTHAYVSLDFEGLKRHIESIDGKYDVIGLCGCEKFNVSQTPLNWFNGSRPFPGNRWGCVSHGELGDRISFFSAHSPDVGDREVACIDGLCIIFSKKAVQSGMKFDPSVGEFDCYDTDISMQAILKYGLRLGVVVRRDLKHFSVGKSILTPRFLESEAKLRRKWGFPEPPPPRTENLA